MLKKRLKPVYLLFLIIPLCYYMLAGAKPAVSTDGSDPYDHIIFSVKTSKPASLNLIGDKGTMISWNVNATGYKILEYYGPLNDSGELGLVISNLNQNDTLSFLGFNFYHNGQIYSFNEGAGRYYTAENATLIQKEGLLTVIVQQSGKPVVLKMNSSAKWESGDIKDRHDFLIMLIFVVAFLLILIIAPAPGKFVAALVVSLVAMMIGFLSNSDSIGLVTMTSDTPVKNAEIFYNQKPLFSPFKKYSSGGITQNYSVPINIEKDRFLRFDVGDTETALKNFKVKIKLGIFSTTVDFASAPQEKLVLNDLILRDDTYYVTGNDPFFTLTSTYFIHQLNWLVFLHGNVYLFISVLAFLALLVLFHFVKRFDKTNFKLSYLFFLLIPATYGFITQPWKNEAPSKSPDQIYFSIRTSKSSVVKLYNGNDSILSWELNAPAFKYLEYSGDIDDHTNLFLKIENLSAKDTLSLLSVNLFHEGQVYSLFNKNETTGSISNSLPINISEGQTFIIQKSGEPVIVNLLPFDLLKKDKPESRMGIIIIMVFFMIFLIVLIIAPSAKFFIISCIVSSLMMFVYYWVSDDLRFQLTVSTNTALKRVDFYYNNTPHFTPKRIKTVEEGSFYFKTQADIKQFKFLRCDVDESVKELKKISICAKAGLLKNTWNYQTLPLGNTLLNDLIKHGDTYYIHGNDPFFVLTSSNQVHSIRWLLIFRQSIFLFITLFFFLAILVTNRYVKKQNLASYFFILTFFALISFGLIVRPFNSDINYLLSERRNATQKPIFQMDSTIACLKGYDDYLTDQFAGRNNIVIANNLVEYSMFKQLINNPVIHFGKDGWMFFIGGKCGEYYENKQPLTPQELKKMKDVLVARRDWLKKRGIHFYLVFPPSSNYIYEEKIGPRLWQYNKKTKLDQLLEYLKLHTDLDVIDIYNPILKAKKTSNTDLYYKKNGHWNYHAALVAYTTMIKYIKKDFANIGEPVSSEDIRWIYDHRYNDELLRLLAIDKFFTSHEDAPLIKNKITVDTVYPVYYGFSSPAPPYIYKTSNTDCPSVLVYGDSFAGALMAYLPYNFRQIIGLWTPLFYSDIIEKEKPDIVIQEMADYTVSFILDKNPPMTEMKDTIPEKLEKTQTGKQ
jgi:alginate O-acetyltransferase complex protein AlgJ